MIAPDKRPWTSAWLARDAEKRIRASFSAMWMHGLDRLDRALDRGPVVVVSNHTAWWDPLVALYVSERLLRANAFALMDAKNLERLPFFRHVGALGVDLDDPRDGARAIRHATKLLRAPRDLFWVFVSGREIPITQRPLDARPGSAAIARAARAEVVPVALRYEMGNVAKPALWISCGDPIAVVRDVEIARQEHERAIVAELDRIDSALVRGDRRGFRAMFEAREPIMFRVLQWLLVLIARRGLLPR